MKKVISYVLVLVVILGGGGYLLATKADAATPIDPLFKVDLLAESVQRTLTFDSVAKTELEQEILDERAEELEKLLDEEETEEVLAQAVENLDEQRVRTEEKVKELEDDDNQGEDIEGIKNRLETQLQNHLENMERVRERFEQKTFESEEAQENFQKTIENFDNAQRNFQEAVDKMNEARDQDNNTNDDTEDDTNDGNGDGYGQNGNSGENGNR